MIVNKRIVILAKSNMGGRYCPTAFGPFSTFDEAEAKGKEKIKSISWQTAYEIMNRNLEGKIDVTYQVIKSFTNDN